MTDLETKAAQKIAEFEARTETAAALDAAQLLSQVDEATGPDARQRTRNERVKLWGRLLSAIDAKIDPKFDPSWVPPLRVTIDPKDYPVPADPNETYVASIDTLRDPEMRVTAPGWGGKLPGRRAQLSVRYGHAVGLERVAPAPFCTRAFTSEADTMSDLYS